MRDAVNAGAVLLSVILWVALPGEARAQGITIREKGAAPAAAPGPITDLEIFEIQASNGPGAGQFDPVLQSLKAVLVKQPYSAFNTFRRTSSYSLAVQSAEAPRVVKLSNGHLLTTDLVSNGAGTAVCGFSITGAGGATTLPRHQATLRSGAWSLFQAGQGQGGVVTFIAVRLR